MMTNTKQKIFEIIFTKSPVSINELVKEFGFSNQIIHRHIKCLLQENKIIKAGTPPKVYYFPNIQTNDIQVDISINDADFLDKNFLDFSPDGKMLYGADGFASWCKKRSFDVSKEIEFYKNTINKYNKFKNQEGLIDGNLKMKNTFEKVYLDEVYYIDFYSIEKYGKTLLGNLIFYGKQNPDKDIVTKILAIIKKPIIELIENKQIEGFAFIPPSIKRKVQILDEIKTGLNLKQKELKLMKIFKEKIVSQKSLTKKEDRIINARETIFAANKDFYSDKIILIDDAIGSGSTLNETAKKIKEMGISNYVVGIAIVGSYKGFEVINEV